MAIATKQDLIEVDGKWRPTTNSLGKLIHPTLEGIANFWRWFGDSKVVDRQKRPLVVYHGTKGEPFQAFTPGPDGLIYVAASPRYSSQERFTGAEGGRVLPCYAKAVSVLDLFAQATPAQIVKMQKATGQSIVHPANASHWRGDFADAIGEMQNISDGPVPVNRALKALKKDSYAYHHSDGEPMWALTSPAQIKSATGNRGTFSLTDSVMTNPRRRK